MICAGLTLPRTSGELQSIALSNWLTGNRRLLAVILFHAVVHYRFVGRHVHDGARH